MSDLFGDDSDSSLSDCDFDNEDWIAQAFEGNSTKDSDESKNKAELAEENGVFDINFAEENESFDSLEAIREIENLDFQTDGNEVDIWNLENSVINVNTHSAEVDCRNEANDESPLELDKTNKEIERECSQANAERVNNAARIEAINIDCPKEAKFYNSLESDITSEVIEMTNFKAAGNEIEHSISSRSNTSNPNNQFQECLREPMKIASPESQEKESINIEYPFEIDKNQGNSITLLWEDITLSIVVVKKTNIQLGKVTNPIINRAYELSRKIQLPTPIIVPQIYDLYQFESLHEQPSTMYGAPQIVAAPQQHITHGIPTIPKQPDRIHTVPHQLNIHNIPTVPQFGLPQSSNASSNSRAHQNVSAVSRTSVSKRSRESSGESWKYEEPGPSPKKRRKIRTDDCYRQPYEVWQKDILEKEYKKNPNLDKNRRRDLARLTNLCSQQVKVWFQNNRAKVKKIAFKR